MISKMDIYWLGGSPCCGKSTISEKLIEEFGFDLYKCDDNLDRYVDIGVKNNNELMKKISSMSLDETWLRDIDEQVSEEFEFYRIALDTIKKDLLEKYEGKKVIVEGAAILPEFIQDFGISNDRYVCMVPTKEFQLEKYRERKWVRHYLSDCSNTEKAFSNWMERDNRFAQVVVGEAKRLKMHLLVVDATLSIDDAYREVKSKFRLEV